ncbi:hypothetical protein IHE44_0007683 [Lamprotornis superbus]|uniref:Uncharacterized protein n=1 Tax=Lamprotornis superbus TaxID=245042 RepID=A0A835TP28_9PASS|nr:hypothetical protein IHE44_0007683 [Lamprotornis superbus]
MRVYQYSSPSSPTTKNAFPKCYSTLIVRETPLNIYTHPPPTRAAANCCAYYLVLPDKFMLSSFSTLQLKTILPMHKVKRSHGDPPSI